MEYTDLLTRIRRMTEGGELVATSGVRDDGTKMVLFTTPDGQYAAEWLKSEWDEFCAL